MASPADVMRRHEAELLRIDGVQGVALGRSTVIVYVDRDTPSVRAALPQAIEGLPVEVVVSGPFRAR